MNLSPAAPGPVSIRRRGFFPGGDNFASSKLRYVQLVSARAPLFGNSATEYWHLPAVQSRCLHKVCKVALRISSLKLVYQSHMRVSIEVIGLDLILVIASLSIELLGCHTSWPMP